MSNLDNQPDPSWTEVQKGNAQAEEMRKLIRSKFPRTDRLLNGIRFQLPVRRQADYPKHEYTAYWDGQLLMDGLTASRLTLLGDPTRWKSIAGPFLVTNEWLKLNQRTLFVERELGEALKRTDLPEGFCPQDLRWRWNALRLVLPAGLFEGQVFEGDVSAASWDIPSITFFKINKGQSFDYHPDLSKEAEAVFLIKTEGGINRILSEDSNEEGIGFYFYRRISPDQKWSAPLYSACRLTTRRCGHWRRHRPNAQLMTLTHWIIAQILTSPKSNASFLTSCCSWGRSPKNTNPTRYCGPPAKRRAT
jgi:hypothetical protein